MGTSERSLAEGTSGWRARETAASRELCQSCQHQRSEDWKLTSGFRDVDIGDFERFLSNCWK